MPMLESVAAPTRMRIDSRAKVCYSQEWRCEVDAIERWRKLPIEDRERVFRLLSATAESDQAAAVAFNALLAAAPAVYLWVRPLPTAPKAK